MINSRQTSLFIALSALCVLSVTSLVGCGELGPFGLQLTNKGTVERDRVVESDDQGGTVSSPGTSGPGNGAQGNGGVKPGPIVPKPTEPENGNGGNKPGMGEHGPGNGGQGDGGVKPGTGGHGPGNGGQGNGGVKPKPTKPENGNGGQGSEKNRAIMLMLCFSPGPDDRDVSSGEKEFPFYYDSPSSDGEVIQVATAKVPYGALLSFGRSTFSYSLNGSVTDASEGTICAAFDMAHILASDNNIKPVQARDPGIDKANAFVFDVKKTGRKRGALTVFYSNDCNEYTNNGTNYSRVRSNVKCGDWGKLDYQEVSLITPEQKLKKLDKVYFDSLSSAGRTTGIRIYAPPNFQMQVDGP